MKTVALFLLVALASALAQTSLPIVLAQPDQELYGVRELQLFKSFPNADDYRGAFGVDPPKYVLSLRPKTWFDSGVREQVTAGKADPYDDVCYLIIKVDAALNARQTQTCLPAYEAARVNLFPGQAISDSNDPVGQARARPAREIPMRPLLPNEVFKSSPFGVMVQRTDKTAQADLTSGKFLPEDRALLKAIATKVGVP